MSQHLNKQFCGLSQIASRKREKGQSLVELAFMLPILLLLLIGVIEVGRYAYIAILIGNAARAGAAFGAQDHFTAGNPNGIIAAAQNDFQNNGQPLANLTVTSAFVCGCDNAGTISSTNCTSGICPAGSNKVVAIQVTASGQFGGLFNYPGIPSPITIARSSIIRVGT